MSGYVKLRSFKKLEAFSQETLGTLKENYVPFAVLMVAAGVLRASRHAANGQGLEIVSKLRIAAENRMVFIAQNFISKTKGFINSDSDRSACCKYCRFVVILFDDFLFG